jgi:hypothetical protein
MRVFHIKFGPGSIALVDGNKLTVDFDKAGRKMVLESFVQRGEFGVIAMSKATKRSSGGAENAGARLRLRIATLSDEVGSSRLLSGSQ